MNDESTVQCEQCEERIPLSQCVLIVDENKRLHNICRSCSKDVMKRQEYNDGDILTDGINVSVFKGGEWCSVIPEDQENAL